MTEEKKKGKPGLVFLGILIIAAIIVGFLYWDGFFADDGQTAYPIGNMGTAQNATDATKPAPVPVGNQTGTTEPANATEPDPVEPGNQTSGSSGSSGSSSGSSSSGSSSNSGSSSSSGNSGSSGSSTGGSSQTHTHTWATRTVKVGEKWVVDVPSFENKRAVGTDYVCSCGINWGDDYSSYRSHVESLDVPCTYKTVTRYETYMTEEIGHYEDVMGTETYCTGCGAVK